jgi:rare lipoprotein A
MLWIMLAMALAAIFSNVIKKEEQPKSVYIEYGKASWYGGQFEGRRTASGEIFRTDKMTAAHRDLPFGTMVKVTCIESNQSIVVKINDRGPFVKNRVIDLSKAAFDALSYNQRGVITVKLELEEVY